MRGAAHASESSRSWQNTLHNPAWATGEVGLEFPFCRGFRHAGRQLLPYVKTGRKTLWVGSERAQAQ